MSGQTKPTMYDKMIGFNYTDIDTSNGDIRSIKELWKNYLSQRLYGFGRKVDTAGYYCWNDEEKQLYKDPDLVLATDPFLNYSQTNILSIEPLEKGFFRIMNVKGFIDDSTGRFKTRVIFYVMAKKVNDKFKLYNYFYTDKEKLKVTNVRNIIYYYPPDYQFDNKNALMFANFEDSLSKLFTWPVPESLIYLIDKNPTLLMNHLGFVYDGSRGTGKHGGKFMEKDNMILSSINENHRHELVHYFTKSMNPDVIGFFDEGLATYFGGTLGKPFQWHIDYLNDYIKEKPDLDVTSENTFGYIDDKTNPQYVLGAIIIKYTIEKFGFPEVLAL
jgi:hypothetical protein